MLCFVCGCESWSNKEIYFKECFIFNFFFHDTRMDWPFKSARKHFENKNVIKLLMVLCKHLISGYADFFSFCFDSIFEAAIERKMPALLLQTKL